MIKSVFERRSSRNAIINKTDEYYEIIQKIPLVHHELIRKARITYENSEIVLVYKEFNSSRPNEAYSFNLESLNNQDHVPSSLDYLMPEIQGLGFVFATILPHGVFEIPAIILSSSIGVGLGYQIIHRLMKRDGIMDYIVNSIKVFIKRIIPILILAAGIETALIYILI